MFCLYRLRKELLRVFTHFCSWLQNYGTEILDRLRCRRSKPSVYKWFWRLHRSAAMQANSKILAYLKDTSLSLATLNSTLNKVYVYVCMYFQLDLVTQKSLFLIFLISCWKNGLQLILNWLWIKLFTISLFQSRLVIG